VGWGIGDFNKSAALYDTLWPGGVHLKSCSSRVLENATSSNLKGMSSEGRKKISVGKKSERRPRGPGAAVSKSKVNVLSEGGPSALASYTEWGWYLLRHNEDLKALSPQMSEAFDQWREAAFRGVQTSQDVANGNLVLVKVWVIQILRRGKGRGKPVICFLRVGAYGDTKIGSRSCGSEGKKIIGSKRKSPKFIKGRDRGVGGGGV